MNLLEVDNLKVRYGSFEAVRGVSLSLGQGEIVGIVGESGSGKSTLAKVLIGLEKASSGKVNFFPAVSGEKPSLQMIFQDAVGSLNPRMTVSQTLNEIISVSNSSYKVGELLEIVGLSEAVLAQYPREMSGGQCQRVSIARALACKPDILIADEPVSALDVSVQARILNLLRDLRKQMNLSILLVAHDLAVVKNVCDRVYVMERGLFVDSGETCKVFNEPTSQYTKKLLSAVPTL
jgi:peptide/nickel transport system ATP-binding protein